MIDKSINHKNNPRGIRYIVVHCTATPQNTTIEAIQRYWRTVLKWKNPGYHYIVKTNGEIVQLLPETGIANGVAGNNAHSIHISYIGGVDGAGKPIDNRTIEQKCALFTALAELRLKYPTAKIRGHRDFSPDKNKNGKIDAWEWIKHCPGYDAEVVYADLN